MQKPILVLQMQRMGDLILSFPLLGMLQNVYPGHPIWTVAEEQFFSQLMPMAPQTVFFPPTAAHKLVHQSYEAVINLSHRPQAIALAGAVDAKKRYGAHTCENTTYIGGDWALYKASIVHNNKYNLFHWSDLYLLDHVQDRPIPPWNVTTRPQPRDNTIGIFVGASEVEKRPTATHFAKLAKSLCRKGYKTLFLGGPSDIPVGLEAERLSGLKGASLCGKFSVEQLALVLQKLTLFITPDTGPMHLAAWVNTPILNLSLGPVNPWETGPHSSNATTHYVLQPALSCAGCWQACEHVAQCHEKMHPERVAVVAHALIERGRQGQQEQQGQQGRAPSWQHAWPSLTEQELSGLHLYRATQDTRGLYKLLSCAPSTVPTSRELTANFWQEWFFTRLQKKTGQESCAQAFALLAQYYPSLAERMQYSIVQLGQSLRKELKNTLIHKKYTVTEHFWKEFPQVLHPFSSYAHLYLENKEYSLVAWEEIIACMESLYKSTQ